MQGLFARPLGAALAMLVCTAAMAGDLTPPGAPGSTMKTLDEIEARIPIGPLTTPGDANSVYRITQSGSYYLTGPVVGESGKGGIEIAADNVFLDLGGFTLQGVPGALSGIQMDNYRRHGAVRNGSIVGWPGSGIEMRIDFGSVIDVQIADCGRWGVDSVNAYMPTIERVAVSTSGFVAGALGGGIRAIGRGIVRDCVVQEVSGTGIDGGTISSVRNCVVNGVGADLPSQPGVGIAGKLVESCTVESAVGVGVQAAVLIRGCAVTSTTTKYNAPNVVESF